MTQGRSEDAWSLMTPEWFAANRQLIRRATARAPRRVNVRVNIEVEGADRPGAAWWYRVARGRARWGAGRLRLADATLTITPELLGETWRAGNFGPAIAASFGGRGLRARGDLSAVRSVAALPFPTDDPEVRRRLLERTLL